MISIITINYNNVSGLEATLKSVQSQNHKGFEHIVIDGGSDDGSKDIIESYSNQLAYWVSESDDGVYAAMNKGIAVAKGSYLQFLNSGDVFDNDDVLDTVFKNLNDGLDMYYGNLMFVGDGEPKLQTYPPELTFHYFRKRSLGHPASFIKRDLFERVFYYNESFKIASDWEFFICAICKYNASYKHLPLVIAKFDVNGISSNESYKKLIKEEINSSLEKHFSFFLKEEETYKTVIRKFQNPPYSQLTSLLKNKFSKSLILGFIRFLTFIFPNKK